MPPLLADWQLPWAVKMHRLGRKGVARRVYRRILARVPRHFSVLQLMGLIELDRLRYPQALEWLRQAQAVKPDDPLLANHRGVALNAMERWAEGEACLEQARQQPAAAFEATYNLARLRLTQRRFDEALALYEEAARLNGRRHEPLVGLAAVLMRMNRFDEAEQMLRGLLHRHPGEKSILFSLSRLLVLQGRPEEAVDVVRGTGYALRFDGCVRRLVAPARTFSCPRWQGDTPVAGLTVLVHTESGLGDAIQASRVACVLADRGARVVLEVWPSLVRLLRGLDPRLTVIARMDPVPPHDRHVDLDDLPFMLSMYRDRIPPPPNLAVPAGASDAWARRLGPRSGRLRVGFVCSGNPRHGGDDERSMRLAPLLATLPEGVDLVCLQREIRPGDIGALALRPGVAVFSEHLIDFAETAALITHMDLVISVDTSVAHLSATLGKPTWIMLPVFPDPRWMLDRADTPWYPSARLYRQGPEGRWDPVLKAVARDLSALMAKAPSDGEAVAQTA